MRAYPKKRLGQNFLVEKHIREKILNACQFKKNDIVLEIGPGRGEMTAMIAPLVKRLLSIEIDKELCNHLKLRLKHFKNTELVCRDILKVNINSVIARHRRCRSNLKTIKAFGNIPYYLTTPIITHLIKHRKKISCIYLTVQKEFAKRIVAKPSTKDYSSFSIYCAYYLAPKLLFTISKGCFYPVPKVDSAFLEMKVRQRPHCKVGNEEFFFKIVRTAFNQRRKTLKNTLKNLINPQKLSLILKKRGLRQDIRPENLSIHDFAYLYKSILTPRRC